MATIIFCCRLKTVDSDEFACAKCSFGSVDRSAFSEHIVKHRTSEWHQLRTICRSQQLHSCCTFVSISLQATATCSVPSVVSASPSCPPSNATSSSCTRSRTSTGTASKAVSVSVRWRRTRDVRRHSIRRLQAATAQTRHSTHLFRRTRTARKCRHHQKQVRSGSLLRVGWGGKQRLVTSGVIHSKRCSVTSATKRSMKRASCANTCARMAWRSSSPSVRNPHVADGKLALVLVDTFRLTFLLQMLLLPRYFFSSMKLKLVSMNLQSCQMF